MIYLNLLIQHTFNVNALGWIVSLFRTILSVAFTELLKKDTSLFHTLESLLNPVEPKKEQDPEPQKPGVDASTSTDDLHNSVHRPEYTNYPKISEEFIRKNHSPNL